MNADLFIGHPHFLSSFLESKLKIMKTILINPPQHTKYPQLPLGLASIAAVLEQKGHQVEIIDANALQLSERVPCVTLRENTERPGTIEAGANILAGTDPNRIRECAEFMLTKESVWKNPFGDGKAGKKILEVI